ncbi:CcmD family protein [Candidatus Poribacteria bacterium]|nr:CcmD family protein [Candidatus Poribacteria bacterium]
MRIVIIVSFLIVVGLVFLAIQVPTLDQKKIDAATKEAISESQVTVGDEDTVRAAVTLSIGELETKQRKRLKYLVSAYLVIWLVFMLYLVRLGRQQQALDQRLAQLEQESSDSQDESIE